jgi:hypothetical protein
VRHSIPSGVVGGEGNAGLGYAEGERDMSGTSKAGDFDNERVACGEAFMGEGNGESTEAGGKEKYVAWKLGGARANTMAAGLDREYHK